METITILNDTQYPIGGLIFYGFGTTSYNVTSGTWTGGHRDDAPIMRITCQVAVDGKLVEAKPFEPVGIQFANCHFAVKPSDAGGYVVVDLDHSGQ